MRTLVALTVVVLFTVCSTAQEAENKNPQTVDLHFLGEPAEIALKQFAESVGLELNANGERFDLDTPVWLSAKNVTPGHGARLLSLASDLNICIDPDAVTVRAYDAMGPRRVTKGYDVSVITGRFVDYVNQYGEAEHEAKDGTKREQRTAAEWLENNLGYVAQQFWGESLEGSVVGDRILYTTTPEIHALVREFLDMMMAEHGGESQLSRSERAQLNAFKAKSGKTDFKERPLASVLANLCIEAGADFLIDPSVANSRETHIDWTGGGSYLEQAKALLRREDEGARIASHLGVIYFGMRDYRPFGSLRVFEVGELLKKVDAAYQRQRTKPGREQGFEESLSQVGGVEVIADALDRQLFEQDFSDRVETYGSRILIGGGPTTTDVAETILKEMGWEPPKE